MQYLVAEFILHLFVGLGVATLTALFFGHRGRRRPIFRFGGDDPVSLGNKSYWVGWYVFSLFFEMISSFLLGPSLYRELALSLYQAVSMTLGLFIADRVAMMFEPEEYWLPKVSLPIANLEPIIETSSKDTQENTIIDSSQDTSHVEVNHNTTSWIAKKVNRAMHETAAAPAGFLETAYSAFIYGKEKLHDFSTLRCKKAEEEKVKKEAERKERIEHMRNITQGH